MREVVVANAIWEKIRELETFLIDELMLSEEAALKRSRRMREFIASLGSAGASLQLVPHIF